jgi:hypothetical protein
MAKQLNFDDFVPQEKTVKEATDITKQTPVSTAYKHLKLAFFASYINSVFGVLSIIVACYAKQTSLGELLPKWMVESEVALFVLLAILVIDLIVIFVKCGFHHSMGAFARIYSIASILPFPLNLVGFVFLTPIVFIILLGLPTIFVLLAFWDMAAELKSDAIIINTDDHVENIDQIRM